MEKRDDKNLSNVVIRKVQEMILSGELQEGDKLPPEREMTQRLGIGRPALREGLKSLEMLGLVERRHGLGNYIINNVQASYFEPLSLSFMLNHGTESEIFEMRNCLETYTAAKAAEIATPSDIRSLRAIAQQMVSARTPSEKASFDRDLHFEIVRITGNMLMYNIMENVSYLIDRFFEKSVQLSYFKGDSIDNIYKEHEDIIDALQRHDAAAATAAMEKHLGNIKVAYL
ncbi:L-lactate utilization operon repressor [uncultured Eubacterium sp.]|nr:L-lactate utilization operon repressor [uncultured Eubacterium sp.]